MVDKEKERAAKLSADLEPFSLLHERSRSSLLLPHIRMCQHKHYLVKVGPCIANTTQTPSMLWQLPSLPPGFPVEASLCSWENPSPNKAQSRAGHQPIRWCPGCAEAQCFQQAWGRDVQRCSANPCRLHCFYFRLLNYKQCYFWPRNDPSFS